MKVRNGFVSNSSSSSFVCFGIRININDSRLEKSNDDYDYLSSNGLSVYPESNSDNIIVGLSPNQMKDDQTLGEFKQVIINKLAEVGIAPVLEIRYFEEASYNG